MPPSICLKTTYFYPLVPIMGKTGSVLYHRSIAKQTDVSPMDPMIAFCYFFMLQERRILALEKYDDPTIQAIYKKALELLSVQKDETISLTLQAQSFCDAVASQFTKSSSVVKINRRHQRSDFDSMRKMGYNLLSN